MFFNVAKMTENISPLNILVDFKRLKRRGLCKVDIRSLYIGMLLLVVLWLLGGCLSETQDASDAKNNSEHGSYRQLISDDWLYLENADANQSLLWKEEFWEAVDLPHTWNDQDTTDNVTGYRRDASWYRKHLIINPSKGRRYFLHFEAAQMKAQIYVNGELVGSHVGGYVSFDVEISGHVFDGENVIDVRVDNSIDIDLIPSQKADFFQFGGLTRDVWLEVKPSSFIKSVKIKTPEVSRSIGRVSLVPDLSLKDGFQPARLESKIFGPDGSLLASGPGSDFVVQNPALWSPDTPSLYRLRVEMIDDTDSIIDIFEDHFGFRWYEFKPHGPFFLNGERLLLRGTHLHEDHAGFGSAMPDEQRKKDIRQIKELGANFIRLGHYPHDPVIYDEADRLGLILWDEVPWNRGGVGGAAWQKNTHHITKRMIEQNYNRPSIFFWGLGNEMVWDSDAPGMTSTSRVLKELKILHAMAKEIDPDRLTVIRKFTEGAEVVDVYSPSIWMGWYGGGYHQYEGAILKYREEVPALLHMEYGGSSHVGRHVESPFGGGGVGGNRAQVSVEEAVNQVGVTSVAKSYVWDETYIVDLFDWTLRYSETDPLFTGSAQWAFKDFGTPIRPENPIPFVNQKGLVDRSGQPKDAYHVFASYWKKEPVCWIESDTWTDRYGRRGEAKTISVFCNSSSAQLYLNEIALGTKVRDITKNPASGLTWDVIFEEGINSLRVEGYDDDSAVVAGHEISVNYLVNKPGKLKRIDLKTERRSDGSVFIRAEAFDSKDRPCITCTQTIYFTHNGGGRFVKGLGTPGGGLTRQLANGRASILFEPGESDAVVGVQTQDFKGHYVKIPKK